MKRLINWAVIALMGMTLVGTIAAEAATIDEVNVQTPQRGQRGRGNAQRQAPSVEHQQYIQNRLDAIAKAAGLTEDEKAIVAVELKKYDDVRLQTWVETRKIHEDLAALGDKATDKQYRDSLQKLADLSAKRQKASEDFISSITQKLTPKKAYLVHRSYRNFNVNTGRKPRQS